MTDLPEAPRPLSQRLTEALTFDDVLLVPAYSDFLPAEASLETRLTRKLSLRIPLLSAAMDTVTESTTAICMARLGGLGVVHKNMTPEAQAAEVRKVKAAKVEDASKAAVDSAGALLAAAAVGVGADRSERVEALTRAGLDVLVIDTAHGHSAGVLDAVRWSKRQYPELELIAGNVATREATEALIEAGVDGVKVGIGPGSICTTRVVSGVGVPQLSAIADCAQVAAQHGVPVIADGGIRYSGEVVKALAVGASTVMLGSLLAGTDESPGALVQEGGATFKSYRGMGSLGAMKRGSKDRYGQGEVANEKLVPEGVEARVPYRGSLEAIVFQLVGGLRAGMGYTGCQRIEALWTKARFVKQSGQGLRESHVHDVTIDEAAPNY